jgi:glutaredoxin 3
MEFEKPSKSGFTIYSKSGCPNCIKAKTLLKSKHLLFNVVECDEYLIEDKDNFLTCIKELANQEVKTFPIIFYDEKFIGGYNETNHFVEELLLSFEANF